MEPARLSLNQITLNSLALPEAVAACERHEIGSIALWRDKIAGVGLGRAAELVRSAGLHVSSVCRGGMFTDPAVDVREDNRRAVEEAATLEADCLVLVCGPALDHDLPAARERVRDGIADLLPHARAAGVKLAVEPLHPMMISRRSVVNTLRQALDLSDAFDAEVGVIVDAYHVWWDPELDAQIARAGERILGYHVSDWLPETADLLLDRGMMGDGLIDLPRMSRLVAEAGYTGPVEVEILSSHWWAQDPDDVARTVRKRFEEFV
ncbi:sugar phosphate isomerase/epimerase family protein [Kineococcus rhizosphaerae]|uniref:Sugar phosphate isomerase/epimerase n=1 Tax=Kineococcus rhizosphaerae TaxID=559628 RepID=A0A2T0R0M2_9ACTN|nr:sugar phosphate isomerase/epimerase family protein [Kineococcus rhizosphaerae]PRY12837.1 sugar phosphate isomerase/epimerase [Kineococcus rhizosphaerae]